MNRNTVLGGKHRNAKERDKHSNHLAPCRALQAKNHGQRQDVDRTHAYNNGGMAHGREMKPNRKANLVTATPKKPKYRNIQKSRAANPRRRKAVASENAGIREQRKYVGTIKTPAKTTRREAMANGGRYKSPIFAAMKLTAHTTIRRAIDAVMTPREGARPAAGSICTESGQPFFSNGKFFDEFAARCESDAGSGRHANRALRRHGHFGIDDVFRPIAIACGYVAGQGEIRKRGERDIVRSADAGFEHATAPNGDAALLAKIVDAACDRVAADAAELDVDNLAGAEFHGGARLLLAVNAFIEADRRVEFLLQLDVAVKIVPAERLLNHHEIKAFELFQERPVFKRVSGVSVYHQLDAWEILPQALHLIEILAGLDLDFDPLVAGREFLFHRCNEFIQRIFDADGDAASDFFARSAKQFRKRHGFLSGFGFPDGSFESSRRHVVAAYVAEKVPDFGGRTKFPFL